METDTSAHVWLKYGLLFFGVMLIAGPASTFLKLGNENDAFFDSVFLLIVALIGVLFILLFLLFKDKFVKVELRNQTIKIKKGTKEIEVGWLDVESMSRIVLISPPLYRMKIKNYGDYFLFATGYSPLNIAGFMSDLSEMGEFISKKKRELDF